MKIIVEQSKEKGKYSKGIVLLVILLNVLFASAVLYAFIRVGNEPTTLIISWFGFTTGELLLLAGIKNKKIKKKSNRSDTEGEGIGQD